MRCEYHDRECYACGQCEPKREQKHKCFKCDSPIYVDDIYYEISGEKFCSACVDEGRMMA